MGIITMAPTYLLTSLCPDLFSVKDNNSVTGHWIFGSFLDTSLGSCADKIAQIATHLSMAVIGQYFFNGVSLARCF